MRKNFRLLTAGLWGMVGWVACPSFGEEVALVTYSNPQAASDPNLHVNTATVGAGYLSASAAPNRLLIESRFGIGTVTPQSLLHLQMVSTAPNADPLWLDKFSNTGDHSLIFRHARGVPTSPGSLFPGDELGSFEFHGYTGTGFSPGYRMRAIAEAGWSGGATPASLIFRNGNLDALTLTSQGRVGIGTSVPSALLHVTDATAQADKVRLYEFRSSPEGSRLSPRRARGTVNAPAPVSAGDELGSVAFRGHMGSGFTTGSVIRAIAEANWAPGSTPSSLLFRNPTSELVRLTSQGNVGIGTPNPASLQLSGQAPDRTLEISAAGGSASGKPGIVLRAGSQYGLSAAWEIFLRENLANSTTLAFHSGPGDTNAVLALGPGGVGIGMTSPHNSALLDLNSASRRAFLPPRMTTAERDAILNPPEGLLIYNTTLNALNLYTGVAAGWIILGTFQVDLFYVRGPDYTSTGCPGAPNPYPWTETPVFPYCVYRGTAWTAMRRMSIPNVQLSQGDIIRLTFFGDYMGRFEPGSNITGPYSQLRYVFDNGTTRTPYGPYMNVGAYEDEPLPASVFQFGYPYLAILRCGTGAGEVPPGTYTIDLEVLPDPILVDSATERSRGALAVARNGDYYLCVERIR